MSDADPVTRFETPEEVQVYVRDRLPDFDPTGRPTRLPEGNLNVVWRVPGADRSIILKHAPPHIAVDPETPLDPSRLMIEARCLDELGPGGELASVCRPSVRPPRRIDLRTEPHVLLMEDCGDRPTLGQWLRSSPAATVQATAPRIGRRLGRFIGRLHGTTSGHAEWATAFDNRPMQETRLAVQYRGVADMLRTAGVPDADALGARAERLGADLLSPGRCLTMGDLWPLSILVADADDLRVIDWELAHYGRPLQDVAHWRAHLWMHKHRAASEAIANAVSTLHDAFLEGYTDTLGEKAHGLWDEAERQGGAIHFGAEILVRAVGPFQSGYVYEGQAPGHPVVQEAVTIAARALRSPESVDLLSGMPER